MNEAEFERQLTMLWVELTPVILVAAAIIMFLRLVFGGRWRSRMARASFGLILSYAVVMLRLLVNYLTPRPEGGPEPAPAPEFWAFYFAAAAYFGYALLLEWVVPATVRGVLFAVDWIEQRRLKHGRSIVASDRVRDAKSWIERNAGPDATESRKEEI